MKKLLTILTIFCSLTAYSQTSADYLEGRVPKEAKRVNQWMLFKIGLETVVRLS